MNKIIKNLAIAASLAAATFATALSARAVDPGDIYSIDLVDSGLYGGRIPSENDPLKIGEKAVIRVRLLNRNFGTSGTGWRFVPKDSTLTAEQLEAIFPPELGIMLGGQPVYAKFVDLTEVTTPAYTYTDLFFEYTVKSGDLAMPAHLMNSSGTAASSTIASDYALRYLGTYWRLTNNDGDDVIFCYGETPGPHDWFFARRRRLRGCDLL